MAVYTTVRKHEENEDERTVSATDFIERLMKIQREKKQLRDIPNTELPKDKF